MEATDSGHGRRHFFFVFAVICLIFEGANGTVVLLGTNLTKYFDDAEALFAPAIKRTGQSGFLYRAEPRDACTPLTTRVNSTRSKFALIVRGNCQFDHKIRNARDAGFRGAIVYDNVYQKDLITMEGDPKGINITAVFVSRESGEALVEYAENTENTGRYAVIAPVFSPSAWSVTVVFIVSLLVASVMIICCFFAGRRRKRERGSGRDRTEVLPRFSRISNLERGVARREERDGMSLRLVNAMPSVVYSSGEDEEDGTPGTPGMCAICLEDYVAGDRLRILLCHHKFHAACVDSWLTKWRTFCPVCKLDARKITKTPLANESTPLFSAPRPPHFSLFALPNLSLPFSNYIYSPHRSFTITVSVNVPGSSNNV